MIKQLWNKKYGAACGDFNRLATTLLASIVLFTFSCSSYASSQQSDRNGTITVSDSGGICNADALAEGINLAFNISMGDISDNGTLINEIPLDIVFGTADKIDHNQCDYKVRIERVDEIFTSINFTGGSTELTFENGLKIETGIIPTFNRGDLVSSLSNASSQAFAFKLVLYASPKTGS